MEKRHSGTKKAKPVALKTLTDQSKFRIDLRGGVVYTLQSLDHKKRMATYTSDKSGMTFTKGWGKTAYPC